jgi:dsDNA-specific endonuclease/ATPase MutS2
MAGLVQSIFKGAPGQSSEEKARLAQIQADQDKQRAALEEREAEAESKEKSRRRLLAALSGERTKTRFNPGELAEKTG